MVNYNIFIPLFILWSLLLYPFLAISQDYSSEQVKSAFIYNFGQEVKWNNSVISNTFQIGFIGNDKGLYESLLVMSRLKKIKGKSINIVEFKAIDKITFVHVLFVSNELNNNLSTINRKIDGKQTLLVTDGCTDKKQIMINFVEGKENNVLFQINKIPFIQKNMSYSNQILVLGGEEIDIARLYLEYEKEIISQNVKLRKRQKLLEKNLKNITKAKKEIELLKTKVDLFESRLKIQEDTIKFQFDQIIVYNDQIEQKQEQLEAFQDSLSIREEEFKLNQKRANELEFKIRKSESFLEKQNFLIESKQEVIDEQELDLSSKEDVISDQKRFLYFFLLIIFLTAVFSYLIYKGSQANKRSARLLKEKNIEIKKKNEELVNKNEAKTAMIKEIHHRVKNNLQVVRSLLNMQSRNIEDQKIVAMFEEAQKRILSMALIHEKMYHSDDLQHINVHDHITVLVENLVKSYAVEKNIELDVTIGDTYLGIRTLVPLGLIINEMISNALKYAFKNKNEGKITVRIKLLKNKTYEMIIGDDGIGLKQENKPEGMGTKLIQIFTKQLNGTLVQLDKPGTIFKLIFERIDTD